MTHKHEHSSCTGSECEGAELDSERQAAASLERQALASRMNLIKRKILVLSGKGGVGKSTVAVNLAAALVATGKKVGILDIDIHGPSIPKLLHLEGSSIHASDTALSPVEASPALRVMSIGFLLRNRDDAVIWRGPMKYNAIKQFLKDVDWGELDYLIVDSPPGTGDEPLSVVQLIEKPDGAVIVTTPQALAIQDVRRCIMFCRQLRVPVLGVVENMSGLVCPHCGESVPVFGVGGGRAMAEEMGVGFLGSVPIEPEVVASGDEGRPIVQSHPESQSAQAFARVVQGLLEADLGAAPAAQHTASKSEAGGLRIAVPVDGGKLSSHFGHCEQFLVFDVDSDGKTIRGQQALTPPRHEPGVLPGWLREAGANVIIAGGMGSRAQDLFAENQVKVVVGATVAEPEQVVRAYLDGILSTSENPCDH